MKLLWASVTSFSDLYKENTSAAAISHFLCLWFTMSCTMNVLFALQRIFWSFSLCVSLPFAFTANLH